MSDAIDGTDLLPAEVAGKLKAEHGEFIAVSTKAGVAAFRVFTNAEFSRWQDMVMDKKTQGQATGWIVRSCCIYPDKATFQQWLDKYPGIATTCSSPLLEFGGVETDAQQKKYGSA